MQKHEQVRYVALSGLLGNILLLTLKLLVGIGAKSQTMIADGLNSAGDVFASTMTYIGNHISSQPGDSDHPYGHGKAEYIFSMIISFSLLLVAFTIFRSALNSLLGTSEFVFNPWLIGVALFTMVLKSLLYIYSKRVGSLHKSLLAIANAQDHRNDVFVSSLTLLSVATGYFGLTFIDGIGGILISFWIAFNGFTIFTSAYDVLMDKNIDDDLMGQLTTIIMSIDGVDHIDAITAKPIGLHFLLIVKISIDANITVYEGHGIAHKVRILLENLENVDEVIVHVNPAQYHPERMER